MQLSLYTASSQLFYIAYVSRISGIHKQGVARLTHMREISATTGSR